MKLISLMLLMTSFSSWALLPEPLVLSDGEEIVFEGGAGDFVQCGNNYVYDQHVFNIKVTKNDANCDEDGNVLKKIYVDGVLRDVCAESIKTTLRKLDGIFTDFENLLALSDEEFKKFVESTEVGNCYYSPPDSVKSTQFDGANRMQDSFRTYRAETQIEMKQATANEATTLKAFRDFISAGHCGNYSAERIAANQENSQKRFGRADVGFDYFVSKGISDEDLIEMGYPVARLRGKGISLDLMVAAGKSPRDLFDGGFKVQELIGKFSLRQLVGANLSAELKASGYQAQDLKNAGASLQTLHRAGFDLARDLKPIFTLREFMAVRDSYNSRVYGNDVLRTVGFTAAELKGGGVGIQDLQRAGYNLRNDLKPLFSLQEFMAVRDSYNSRVYSNSALRETLGYSAEELKGQGVGIQDLERAGYTMAQIRPLFTLQQFMDVKDSYNTRVYTNEYLRRNLGFTARELKERGVGIRDLEIAGYNLKNDLTPLFTLEQFMAVRDSYNSRVYSNAALKDLGYTATQLKGAGLGIQDLQRAGFDMNRDIRPLFTVQNFVAVRDSYNSRVYKNDYLRGLGFTASDLKGAGVGIQDLQSAGFNLKNDIKPLYSIQDFIRLRDS
jgi:biotin operon repressor